MNNKGIFWRDPVVWLLVGVGLLIRIFYNLALHPDGRGWSGLIIDEREYFGAAHMLAEGRGFSFFDTAMWVRPPLFIVFLAPLIDVGGGSTLPALLAQSLVSAATLLPVGLLAHRVAGTRAARWAIGLGALYLPFTLFAGLLLSETLFLLLVACFFVLVLDARQWLAGPRRRAVVLACACGLLLGLAALTRATIMGFVPVAALWLFFAARESPWRKRLGAVAILLCVCGATLLPWTLRNYHAYGRLVAVDTTSGYNLWLASVGVRDEERLQGDLRAIKNPADRQSFAFARAWENIWANPGGFAAKGLKESLDLWRPLFSAEERRVRGFTLGRVPGWHLASLLLFDDLLYVAVLFAAIAGLALSPPHPLKGLTGLWVALWVVLAFVFFAVTRFRLPVVAMLIPWAGVGLSLLATRNNLLVKVGNLSSFAKAGSVAAALAIVFLVVPAIPIADILLGVERWGQQAAYRRGEELLEVGRAEDAIAQYQQANLQLSDTRYGLAAAYLQTGQVPLALSTLRDDEPEDHFEPAILRGEAARLSGDLNRARSFFNARVVQVADDLALQWAWDHLRPAPVDSVALGSGLDVGYVAGFYRPETDENGVQFRWSGERPLVRGLRQGNPEIVWSGWRPRGLPPAQVLVESSILGGASYASQHFSLENSQSWLAQRVGSGTSGPVEMQMAVNPFIGSGEDPRLLGVRISAVRADR